jgi:hypothetical protein
MDVISCGPRGSVPRQVLATIRTEAICGGSEGLDQAALTIEVTASRLPNRMIPVLRHRFLEACSTDRTALIMRNGGDLDALQRVDIERCVATNTQEHTIGRVSRIGQNSFDDRLRRHSPAVGEDPGKRHALRLPAVEVLRDMCFVILDVVELVEQNHPRFVENTSEQLLVSTADAGVEGYTETAPGAVFVAQLLDVRREWHGVRLRSCAVMAEKILGEEWKFVYVCQDLSIVRSGSVTFSTVDLAV